MRLLQQCVSNFWSKMFHATFAATTATSEAMLKQLFTSELCCKHLVQKCFKQLLRQCVEQLLKQRFKQLLTQCFKQNFCSNVSSNFWGNTLSNFWGNVSSNFWGNYVKHLLKQRFKQILKQHSKQLLKQFFKQPFKPTRTHNKHTPCHWSNRNRNTLSESTEATITRTRSEKVTPSSVLAILSGRRLLLQLAGSMATGK